LWWPFAIGWFGTATIAVATPVAIGLLSVYLATAAGIDPDPENPVASSLYTAGALALMLVAGFFLWLAVWAPYNAAAMNRIAGLIELDGARFRLRAKTISLFLITLAGWLITIFSLGLLAPVAGFLQIRYVMNRLEIVGSPKFAEIGQAVVEGPKAGEGWGDAFDLDMGVGVI
jgi:uncharacterized membrane protein YjgN (DUF898 family)